MLFGILDDKDIEATGAWHDCGIVEKATMPVQNLLHINVVVRL